MGENLKRFVFDESAFRRLLSFDTFNGVAVLEGATPGDDSAPWSVTVEPGEVPAYVLRPDEIRQVFETYRETRETFLASLRQGQSVRLGIAQIFLLVHAKLILALKCFIGVYNYFNVPNAGETGMRYSTILTDDFRNDLTLALVVLDSVLGNPHARTPECRHVMTAIDDTMHQILKFLTAVARDEAPRCGLGAVRVAYRSFHVWHDNPEGRAGLLTGLLAAIARLGDFFADREGCWMRNRPEPELEEPVLGIRLGRCIPNKVVADCFNRSENTICLWNRGKGRPWEYNGPYPETDEGNSLLIADSEHFVQRCRNEKRIISRTR